MKTYKVNRTAFSRLRQDNLSGFASAVVHRMENNNAYVQLQDYIQELKERSVAFNKALTRALNRGKIEVNAKNQAKEALLESLYRLADALDLYAQDNENYILNTGFSVQGRKKTFKGELQAPVDLKVIDSSSPGQLRVACKIPQKKYVKLCAVEWSTDNENWHNGNYFSQSRFVLKGLPSRTFVSIRMRCLGNFNRKSAWTEPVVAPVL